MVGLGSGNHAISFDSFRIVRLQIKTDDLPYIALFGSSNGTGEMANGSRYPCVRFPMMTRVQSTIYAISEFDT